MIAVVALLLAGCSRPADVGPGTVTVPADSSSATSTTTTEPSTTSPATTVEPLDAPIVATGNRALDGRLLELARFVEETRGHPFLEPVDVTFLDDAAFEAVVLSGLDDNGVVQAIHEQQDLLVALELLPPDVDLVSLVRIQEREGVVGLYVPSEGSLYIRGEELTPLVAITVVHELTHALDDQWFDLDDEVDTDADVGFAHSSLAEGSARWVENEYVDTLTYAEYSAAADEADEYIAQMDWGDADWPIAVNEITESVYSLGVAFVGDLVGEDGDTEALDAAFASPPDSTEQLLHPERYAAGDTPVEVDEPEVDGTVVATGVLGELSLIELLNAELSPAQSRDAAEGWGGDRWVLTEDGSTTCVTLVIVADTDDDAQQLYLAFLRWTVRQHDAEVERDGLRVEVTSCH